MQRLLSKAYKLHPLNTLFGRLFLWFWLTTIIIMMCTFFVVKQVLKSDELQTIPAPEQELLVELARQIETVTELRNRRIPMKKVLGRIMVTHDVKPVLLSHDNDELLYEGKRLPPEFEQRFINLKNSNIAYGFLARNEVFFGPQPLEIRDQKYSLFTGRMIRIPLWQRNRPYMLAMAIIISGLLCFSLAWSLSRPIKRLREATQRMADGDLSARVDEVGSRKDEIGELSRDFNAMSEKVNLLMLGQKRLLADISHELRSPLARLQLAIGIAQDNNQSGKLETSLLERIEKEAHQIEDMIGRVLQLSRLENSSNQLHKQQINLASMLEVMFEDATYEANSLQKQFQNQDIPNVTFEGDPELLTSAIENIIRNAIKFASSSVHADFKQTKNGLQIIIEDDGPGVPENEIDQLFKPFYRVSEARNRETGGTGLGLAIAMQAVLAHQGSLSARNKPEGGLRIVVSLPIVAK
ncbi:MAG: HAMP domain-containing protein [Alteromonadaceae bacterium]|nr:HAMP domain-containing protein [Alteromonadaceae bacterium]